MVRFSEIGFCVIRNPCRKKYNMYLDWTYFYNRKARKLLKTQSIIIKRQYYSSKNDSDKDFNNCKSSGRGPETRWVRSF